MKHKIYALWNTNPIALILWLAIVVRLVAVIFSKGFGMHDDHFLIIEPAQAWVDGLDNSWLPGSTKDNIPTGHSFFYVGINYLILLFLKAIGFTDPQSKMYVIRFIHAAFSLLLVYYGYKITFKLSDKKTARSTALLLAVFWFMPNLSVRNLVEVVCIPFLVYGLWIIIDRWDQQKALRYFFLAGIIIGLAFSVRFQSILFAGGIGLALLLKLRWKEALLYGLGFLTSAVLIQGGIDSFVWGSPFTEFSEYVRYNIENANNYLSGAWYKYLLLILGILIPPISIFIFFGFFRMWKKHLIIFLPTFIFLLFHSFFPNKQERFILPIIPFIIILGMIGWQDFIKHSSFFDKRKKLLHSFWVYFWIINLLMLAVFSTMYSKRARVESMSYLSKYKNIKTLLLEDANSGSTKMTPRYYLGQWPTEYEIINTTKDAYLETLSSKDPGDQPQFFLFFDEKNLEQRLQRDRKFFPGLTYETTIEPGFVDKVLYYLNPVNSNQTIIIYRNNTSAR